MKYPELDAVMGNSFFQQGGWQPDSTSLWLGFVLGLLVAVVFAVVIWPRLQPLSTWLARRWQGVMALFETNVEERYKSELIRQVENYPLAWGAAKLPDVFVMPRLLAPWEEPDPIQPIDFSPRQMHTLWPSLANQLGVPAPPMVSLRELLWQGRRVAICGQAGTGKSSLLAYCAYLCATAEAEFAFLNSFMPIWIHVADLPNIDQGDSPDVLGSLAAILERHAGRTVGTALSPLILEKLKAGLVILLLDGLDEIPRQNHANVNRWLRQLLGQYPGTRVIVAAPERGYAPLLQMDFVISGLLSWRAGQAETLAAKMAQALKKEQLPLRTFWSAGSPAWKTAARLEDYLAVGDAAASKSGSDRAIDALEAALSYRLPKQRNGPEWLAPVLRELWQEMAYYCLSQRASALSLEQIENLVEVAMTQYDVGDRGARQRILEATYASSMFTGWGEGGLRFTSPLWRDFLAAAHVVQARRHQLIQSRLSDPDWQGVLASYVGRAGAGKLAGVIMGEEGDDPREEGIFKMARLAPEALDKGEWRRKLLLRLGRLVMRSNTPLIIRQRAILAMAQSQEAGVATFLRQLAQAPHQNLRQAAVSALSGIDPSTAVDTLTQAMGDENPNVRQAVVHALAWLNAKPSARILKEALLRDEDSVQQAAAEGLALMGKEEAEALRDIARDSNPAIRRAAIFGLVLLDEPWVLPLVQKLAVDGQWAVQTVASAAVTLLTGTELSEAWEATTLSDQEWLHNWAAQARRVVPAGPAALSMAEEALEPGQQEIVRLLAIVALGFMSNKKCMPALKRVLEDSASTMVREAVHVAFYQTSRAYDQWVGP